MQGGSSTVTAAEVGQAMWIKQMASTVRLRLVHVLSSWFLRLTDVQLKIACRQGGSSRWPVQCVSGLVVFSLLVACA